MKVPQVSTAFCGQSLRAGSMFIAWFSTVFVGIIWSLYLSLLPTFYSHYRLDHHLSEQGLASVIGMILTYFFIEHCLLLRGVLKKQHYYFLPWIVVTSITIGLGFCVAVISFVLAFAKDPMAFLVFFPNSLISSCLIYCLLVIFSYYREIRRENSTVIQV